MRHYISGDAVVDATTVRLQQVHEGPAVIAALTNGGVGYPLTVIAQAESTTPRAVTLGTARCPGMSGDPAMPLGDEYVGTLPLTNAGKYDLTLRANGVPFPGYPKPAVVAPAGVSKFELVGLNRTFHNMSFTVFYTPVF